jgi:hypothetical protein
MNGNGVVIETSSGDRRDVWKWVATSMAAITLGLAGFAAKAATATSPSRAEVERIVQTESPYLQDKGAIQLQLAQQTAALNRLTDQVQQLRVAIASKR